MSGGVRPQGRGEAIEAYQTGLALEDCPKSTQLELGFTFLVNDQSSAAVAELDRFLETVPDIYPFYAGLWRTLALRRLGRDDEARPALDTLRSSAEGDWQAAVLAFHRREVSAPEFVARARDPGERCEAYFYIGYDAMLEGRSGEALISLREARSSFSLEYYEHKGAGILLASLGEAPG